jgi:hypothetical protein
LSSFQKFLDQSLLNIIQTQELFNEAYLRELQRLLPILDQYPELDPILLDGIVPAHTQIDEFEIKCRLLMEVDRQRKVTFSVRPIPLQLEVIIGEHAMQHQEIQFHVQQVPLHENPLTNL